jgi:hypothetical protein
VNTGKEKGGRRVGKETEGRTIRFDSEVVEACCDLTDLVQVGRWRRRCPTSAHCAQAISSAARLNTSRAVRSSSSRRRITRVRNSLIRCRLPSETAEESFHRRKSLFKRFDVTLRDRTLLHTLLWSRRASARYTRRGLDVEQSERDYAAFT